MRKILLTGNHLTPALAFKAKLEQHHWQVDYLSLDSAKFNRHQPLISFLTLIKLPSSLVNALIYLTKTKPLAVVSFGGYSAFPVCLAAKLLRLPLVIHEQTFGQGLTSKLTAYLADKIAVSWPKSRQYFPKHKTVLTGNPLRPKILNIKMLNANCSLLNTIYITGGHQGSLTINQAIKPILPQLLSKYVIFHQFGLSQPPDFKDKHYFAKKYFTVAELAKIYSQAPLVISRAGINTVTELAYLGLKAILIPLTTAQKNEQLTNARYLESLGLAIVLDQINLSPQNLLTQINRFFAQAPIRPKNKFPRQLVLTAADNLYQLVSSLIK